MTLSDFFRSVRAITQEILVSPAPCASAITLMPFLPSAPKNLPAIPGTCFMFCPTMAMVARSYSTMISLMLPMAISCANSLLSTFCDNAASCERTPIEVLFSEEAWETMKTLMPLSANTEKMRLFTPMTPTIPSP